MQISGLEKLTVTDFPGFVSCIIFTQGCNFRCPFCQNSDLISNKKGLLSLEEIFNYLKKRKNILDGVVISGGEPTIQPDLKDFILKIKEMKLKVKLDTNGSNYKQLKELIDLKLVDYVAMDIKNSFNHYNPITGLEKVNLENIKKSMELLKGSDIDFEFRTTLVKEYHTYEDILDICKHVGNSKYFLQNFQNSECVLDKNLHGFTQEELKEFEKLRKEFPNVKVRDYGGKYV